MVNVGKYTSPMDPTQRLSSETSCLPQGRAEGLAPIRPSGGRFMNLVYNVEDLGSMVGVNILWVYESLIQCIHTQAVMHK